MLLAELAQTSTAVGATAARSAKVQRVAAVLRRCDPVDVPVAVAYLSGELRQRRTGLGHAALRDVPAPAEQPSLRLIDVDTAFERIAGLAGSGSSAQRRRLLHDLLSACTAEEQRLLLGLVSGELRQGAQDGVMLEAVAQAAAVPAADVRRAVTLAGALATVAAAVLAEGPSALERFGLELGRPLRPMLAQSASGVAAALERLSPAAVEWKLDGIRVQVHRDGERVAVFTRTLDEITGRVPEVVEAALALPARRFVLDGEVIGLRADGRPHPFQVTASRLATRSDVAAARERTPLSVLLFDALHVEGEDLVGAPGRLRWAALERLVPPGQRVPRIVTDDVARAEAFAADAVARGHEGVVVKSLEAPYEAGRRGAGWIKVKPRHTLDLVVLAVEWGHGRRAGWLSNLHLGARDPEGAYGPAGSFVMLGKTFKGLTDAMLRWQTQRLLALADGPADGWVVRVRPELVVEVAFDGVQASPRYPAGVALRFARVLRFREDKAAAEADTIAGLLALTAG